MSYEFLLFDLDHTLMDFDLAEEVALKLLLEDAGVEDIQAYQDFYIPMNKALWHDLTLGKISKPELIQTRFAILFDHFGRKVDGKVYANHYQEILSQQGQLIEGADTLLSDLAKEGHRLFAATNGVTYIQKGRLNHSGLFPYFEKVFISDEIGFHKPNKDFYDHIQTVVTGYDSQQALMIGDSLIADIQGGNNAGLDSVWYNPRKLINDTSASPTYTIKNYRELQDILKDS